MTWTESVGLTLVHRDITSMRVKTPQGQILVYNILQIFPFTSETKRMGIIVRVRSLVSDVFIRALSCRSVQSVWVEGDLVWF